MDNKTLPPISRRKAWLAASAALGCLAIYVMSCVMSPPAWSPDSSKVAVLVTPAGSEEPELLKLFVYDRITDDRTLLDEICAKGMLSAPGWSPDGQWIAYFRVEQTEFPSEIESSSGQSSGSDARPDTTTATTERPSGPRPRIEDLFPGADKVLPAPPQTGTEDLDKKIADSDFFDVKIMLIKPDGSGKKHLATVKWMDEDDALQAMLMLGPVFSPDSKRLFYLSYLDEFSTVGSVDLPTGDLSTHIIGVEPGFALSPDGNWIATVLQDSETVVAARVDGRDSRYFKTAIPSGDTPPGTNNMCWTADSQTILIVADSNAIAAIDISQGTVEPYMAPAGDIFAYITPSPTKNRIFYLTCRETAAGEAPERVTLKCYDLSTRKARTLFDLEDFAHDGQMQDPDGGILSISPDGKVVLMRAAIEGAGPDGVSALIFWDGKTRKVVKTDHWLKTPLYSQADLTFDKSLLGKWRSEDGLLEISKGKADRTYRITWDSDDEDFICGANLAKLEKMTFFGVFMDASAVETPDKFDSHLSPDVFMIIDRADSKLTMTVLDYSEMTTLLTGSVDAIVHEVLDDAEVMEFEPVD